MHDMVYIGFICQADQTDQKQLLRDCYDSLKKTGIYCAVEENCIYAKGRWEVSLRSGLFGRKNVFEYAIAKIDINSTKGYIIIELIVKSEAVQVSPYWVYLTDGKSMSEEPLYFTENGSRAYANNFLTGLKSVTGLRIVSIGESHSYPKQVNSEDFEWFGTLIDFERNFRECYYIDCPKCNIENRIEMGQAPRCTKCGKIIWEGEKRQSSRIK